MEWIRRSVSTVRVVPYAVAIATFCVGALAIWAVLSLFLNPADTLVIEVVPLPDEDLIRAQVEGEVKQPGVYSIPAGSTRADAVEAAGGVEEGAGVADPDSVLADGDIVVVEFIEADTGDNWQLDINTASSSELEALPGVGPVLAQRIVEYRSEQGPFRSIDELANVSGISKRMVDEFRELAVVGGP